MKLILLALTLALAGCQNYSQTYGASYTDQEGRTYGAGVTLTPTKGYAK